MVKSILANSHRDSFSGGGIALILHGSLVSRWNKVPRVFPRVAHAIDSVVCGFLLDNMI